MLQLKNIKKSYTTGTFTQKALDNVSIKFRKEEFVAVLGPSGSGKTTLLNILGGLDRYDSGDLIINGKSTKEFKSREWDAYRNNSVGFIFQSYNLIGHISILANVEMSLKLSNVKKSIRRKKAMEALTKVGLKDHAHKKPNELSGGQMQRVAIARSLVNDPDIILADEPTGALDSNTSTQIMELIKEVAKEKLVIMVTHNEDLAHDYATRIISMKDGKLLDDSNPLNKQDKEENNYTIKKTKMSFKEALFLSLNNIMTKKGRTLLTAFASSIGIIGIALILSLSNGFNEKVKTYEKGIMSAMPIVISEQSINMNEETMAELTGENKEKQPDIDYVIPSKSEEEILTRQNNITKEFMEYIEATNKDYAYGYAYYYVTALNFLQKKDGKVELIDTNNFGASVIPASFDKDKPNQVLEAYYDVLAGRLPEDKNEIILVVDAYNNVTDTILKSLGFDGEENVKFEDILNKTIRLALNKDLYKSVNGMYAMNMDFDKVYDKSLELKVVGIIRAGKDFPTFVQSSNIGYTKELMDYILEENSNSAIAKAQEKADYNVMTGMPFVDSVTMDKETMLAYLGKDTTPMAIYVYPKDFDSKDDLLEYLDKYNEGKLEEDKILYIDQAEMISSMSGSIMSAITIVLIAFSSISLIVSSIMIGIITYISVLERTKEIGILRALGARKKDISRVFNAETFIIGLTSGFIGIGIALLLTIPVNQIIYNLSELENVAALNPIHAIILILVSMTLTLIGGFIPAHIASKKDPVIALRTE